MWARGWIVTTLASAGCVAGGLGVPLSAAALRPPPTVAVSIGTATPEQSIPIPITLSGTATVASTLHALVRPAGTAACGATFRADRQANPTGSIVLASGLAERAGAYATTVSWTPDSTGAYLVCAWLAGGGGAGPASAPLSVRGPQVPLLAVGFSATPTAETTFAIEYTVQTDQPLRLLSTIRPAGTAPACAPSQQDDTAAHPGERVLFPGGVPVSGGPGTTSIALRYPAGSYLVCTWITGPDVGEVDAALATPFTIRAQPIVTGPLPPQLNVTGLTATVGWRVHVRGTTAAGLSGTLALRASCAGGTSRGTATATGGRFSGRLPLPRLCIAHDHITVTVAWPGNGGFGPGRTSGRAIVDPRPRRARRLPLLFARIVRVERRFRDVFGVRPRRMTVGPAALTLRWTSWTAREARGGGLARPAHGRYRVTVRAFHPVRGRFTCLTVTRGRNTHRHTRRYGLGRLGTSTFAWLPARWLHRRASGARPWPRPGCPA